MTVHPFEPRKTLVDRMKALPMVLDKAGKWPVACLENVCTSLESLQEWEGIFGYNELEAMGWLMRPIPGAHTPHSTFRQRELKDDDLTVVQRWFQRHLHSRITVSMVAPAVMLMAARHSFSPVCDYLDTLVWDGVERLDAWAITYLGAEDTAYHRAVSRAWMISAVARALQPGCKADCMLILEGRQGVGKSTALRVLASEEWFSDQLPDLHSKDACSLGGRWITEFAELSAMRRSEVETAKAFMSRQVEHYRPVWARLRVKEPRRCVFAGTTNDSRYFHDTTGNRRYWPVPVGFVDIEALKQDRDQLWAEAVVCYQAGEKWHLEREMEQVAADVAEDRLEEDTWGPAFEDYLRGRNETSTRQCLGAVGISPGDQTKLMARRAAGVLRVLGFKADGRWRNGESSGLTRYVREGKSDGG